MNSNPITAQNLVTDYLKSKGYQPHNFPIIKVLPQSFNSSNQRYSE